MGRWAGVASGACAVALLLGVLPAVEAPAAAARPGAAAFIVNHADDLIDGGCDAARRSLAEAITAIDDGTGETPEFSAPQRVKRKG